MDDSVIQRQFFRPICSSPEIDRIFNVTNAADYLLKLRAETIVDHMRLFRVYRNKALLNEKSWSLEGSFSDLHYKAVLAKLPPFARALCRPITFGDIFSNDPNGMIFPTEHGPVTTISEALKFFLEFSHLALLDSSTNVPPNIRFNSLRIAIRVMLKTEALDFYMDPRGIIPANLASAIHAPIPLQLQFIAGHEFAHFILGHLSDKRLIEQPIFYSISPSDDPYKPTKIYNTSQRAEFDADLKSIVLPNYSARKRGELLRAALLWFGCLELYESACDVMLPASPRSYKSHPTAMERYETLLTSVQTPQAPTSKYWKEFPKLIKRLKELLQDDISKHCDFYEMYGSAYLDVPNTQWRGKERIDRVDYY
jgi:hypothetical protein